MAGESKVTTDHDEIRKWAEARDGKPATVRRTGSTDEPGVLRIDFPGYRGEDSLEEITWDEFFQKFDEKNLAFLYQEETSSGEESRFFKLVSRDTAEHKTHSAHPKAEEKHETKSHAKSEQHSKHESKSKSDKPEHKTEHNGHKAQSKSHKS